MGHIDCANDNGEDIILGYRHMHTPATPPKSSQRKGADVFRTFGGVDMSEFTYEALEKFKIEFFQF